MELHCGIECIIGEIYAQSGAIFIHTKPFLKTYFILTNGLPLRHCSETKSYTLAGAWYAGIFAYFYVGVRNVPFSVMPVLITLAALRPLKTPL